MWDGFQPPHKSKLGLRDTYLVMRIYMKIKIITLAIFSSFLIQGCQTASTNIKHSYSPSYYSSSVIDIPATGETKTVEVGDSLISKDQITQIPSIDIKQPIQHQATNVGTTFMITSLPGRYTEKGSDINGKFYQANSDKFLINGRPFNSPCGVYVPNGQPTATEFYCLSPEGTPISYIRNGITYEKSATQVRDEISFKKELIYTGVSKSVISITYREFKDDLAIPAFSQDLKYDLTESKIVGYKGARFEIIKASNQGITFKMLKPLD